MMDDNRDDQVLERFFAAARAETPQPDVDFIDRLIQQAETMQTLRPSPRGPVHRRIWTHISDGLGGWAGLGGLAAASAAGLWIGISPPELMPDPASYLYDKNVEHYAFEDSRSLYEAQESVGAGE